MKSEDLGHAAFLLDMFSEINVAKAEARELADQAAILALLSHS